MYITFNPVKNNIINGVHGRYFAIFLLPLFVILFQYFHKYSKKIKYIPIVIILLINISLMISVFTVMERFYF